MRHSSCFNQYKAKIEEQTDYDLEIRETISRKESNLPK